jgi:hypothetical protein
VTVNAAQIEASKQRLVKPHTPTHQFSRHGEEQRQQFAHHSFLEQFCQAMSQHSHGEGVPDGSSQQPHGVGAG